jgi:hypothetical protein
MQTTELPKVADRQIYRLVDLNASTEAAAALRAAATASQDALITAADEMLRGGSDDVRDRLRDAILSRDFAALLPRLMRELREVASAWPDSGACTLATALKLWSWTLERFRSGNRPAVDDLAQAVTPLLAARALILDAVASKSDLRLDFAHVYAAHASAIAGATCAELVFGYRRHLVWDAEGCATCYAGDDLDDLESIMPGFAAGARTSIDVIESDGSHPAKRGPCARVDGLEFFLRLRNRLDACLSGSRIARDRAAAAIAGRA